MKYRIAWYDGHGGAPDYSKQMYDTIRDAVEAAEEAIERHGAFDVGYGVVTATSHRRVRI